MARGRMLNKSVSASMKFQNLSDDTCRLMATWIIGHLDKNGVFYGDPMMVKSFIFPRRNDITFEQVEMYLEEMQSAGLIELFEVDGQLWQYWPGFQDNQIGLRPERESTNYPLPPNDDDDDNGNYPPPPNSLPPTDDETDIIQQDDGNMPESIPPKGSLKEGEININYTTTAPAQVANYFTEKTGLTPRGIVASQTWEDDCQDILDKAEGDVTRAIGLIDEAVATLGDKNYTYTCPASLLNTINKLLEPKPRRNGASRSERHKPKTTDPPDWAKKYVDALE